MSDLIAGYVTDVDVGAVQGIAITALTASNGKWQYSLDAGKTWNDVGAVSDTSSLLLRSIDKLRFLPDTMNGGIDHDQLPGLGSDGRHRGLQGTKVNTSLNNGTTPFSAAWRASNIIVTDVNNAPALSGAANFTTITEDQTTNSGNLVSDLIAGYVTDVDTGAVQGIAVTAAHRDQRQVAILGRCRKHVDRRGRRVGHLRTVAASVDKLRYVPDAMNGSTNTVTFRAWDQTGGTPVCRARRSTPRSTARPRPSAPPRRPRRSSSPT